METVNIHDVKTRLSQLVDKAASGEDVVLDTHIFLWAVAGSPLLKPAARRILDSADQVYVSAASIWAVAVKARLGKIDANPYQLVEAIAASGFVELAVRPAHAASVARDCGCGTRAVQRNGFARLRAGERVIGPM